MQTPRAVLAMAGVAVSAICVVPAPSHADDAGWRDGWCRKGEGIGVVIDWHLAPPALATPVLTDGDQTHLVRCVVLGDAAIPPDARALLGMAGLEHNPHGLIASVNGIALDGFEFSWHLRAGTEGRWTDTDWLLDPATHVAMSYTVRDMDPSIVEAPQPVLSPTHTPPLASASPSPTAAPTPTPTGDPADDPTGEPGGEPSGTASSGPTPVESGDPSAEPDPSSPPPVGPSEAVPPTSTTPTTSPTPTPSPTPIRSAIPGRNVTPTPTHPSTTPPPTTTTTTPTPVAPASPAPTPTSSVPGAPPVLWGEEPVEHGPPTATGEPPSRWSGGLIGGLFVALASGGAVLARRWMHHELDTASQWDDE